MTFGEIYNLETAPVSICRGGCSCPCTKQTVRKQMLKFLTVVDSTPTPRLL